MKRKRALTTLTIGQSGEMTLPQEVQERCGLGPKVSVRLIATRSGLLLVPLTEAPMSAELTRELEEWQALGADAWAQFEFTEC